MANYGDVALNLPADWSREANLGKDQEFVLMMVGHDDGIADAYLTKEPDERHQFTWANMKNDSDVSRKRSRGYAEVSKNRWTINENLWRWDDKGHAVFNEGTLFARPAYLYHRDEERRAAEYEPPEKRYNDKLAGDADEFASADLRDQSGTRLSKTKRR